MLWRAVPEGWRRRKGLLPAAGLYGGLALLSGLATAGLEFAWYGLATRINPWRVLASEETIRFGLRPAHWVFLVAVALAVLTLLRQVMPRAVRRQPPVRQPA
jgi:sulfoxide reductase heme-binding subunit YedZ